MPPGIMSFGENRSLVKTAHFWVSSKIGISLRLEPSAVVLAQQREKEVQSCKTTFSRELWTLNVPLYSMNPSLRKRFMKKLTRERVVPIISASVS